jgi:hypothetical protein
MRSLGSSVADIVQAKKEAMSGCTDGSFETQSIIGRMHTI